MRQDCGIIGARVYLIMIGYLGINSVQYSVIKHHIIKGMIIIITNISN